MLYLFVPITLLWALFEIWLIQHGFRFAAVADWIPLPLFVAGIVMVRSVKVSEIKPASLALIGNLVLLSFWPILFHIGLWAMADEFQRVHHAWPQMMVDDPKAWYGHLSPRFDALSDLADSFSALGFFWMGLWIALFSVSWWRLSVPWRFALPLLVCFWIGVFVRDPGGLFAWWLD